jgi:hypothetical protein
MAMMPIHFGRTQNRMNPFPKTRLTSSPVTAPLRYKKQLKPLSPPRAEPLTIYSARNPAMPWLAAAIDGDTGDEDWSRTWVRAGAGVEVRN